MRGDGEKIATNEKVAGILAGHFHNSKRPYYAKPASETSLAIDRRIARKTFVAPPLAVRFQQNANPTARGLLLVTVQQRQRDDDKGTDLVISVIPFWYSGPARKRDCSAMVPWSAVAAITILAALVIGFIVGRINR
jgi:hypothetical protein